MDSLLGKFDTTATTRLCLFLILKPLQITQTPIEDKGNAPVTHKLVYQMLDEIIEELRHTMATSMADCKRLISAKYMLLEIITAKNYIEYITTYLNDCHKFRSLHNKNEGLQAKL